MLRILMNYAKVNRLSKIHPIEKTILFLLPIVIIGFVKESILIISLNILIMIMIHVLIKSPKTIILKFTSGILIFSIFTSISLVFDQGLEYIIILIFKSISGSLCILLFTITTPIEDVLYFGAKHNWLSDIYDIAKNMIRFLILIEDEYLLLLNAVKSRHGFDTLTLRIKNSAKVMGILFINTMRRWKELKEAIDSRGYTGKTVYLERKFDFSMLRLVLEISYNIILVVLISILE